VVEGAPDVALLLKTTFEAAGHSVAVTGSLAEAREWLRVGRTPNLVVLAAELPDGDGLELSRQIAGWLSPPPVLVLTRQVSRPRFTAALAAGASLLVASPFDLDRLARSAEWLIARQRRPIPL
jgi:DNA-binding response OmpR family regulator